MRHRLFAAVRRVLLIACVLAPLALAVWPANADGPPAPPAARLTVDGADAAVDLQVLAGLTPSERERWLATGHLVELDEDKVLVVAWPEPHLQALRTHIFSESLIVIPFALDDGRLPATITGRGYRLSAFFRSRRRPAVHDWERDENRRNWAWWPAEPWQGVAILRETTLQRLGVRRSRRITGGYAETLLVEVPEVFRRRDIEPDPPGSDVVLRFNDDQRQLRVHMLRTHEARARGLVDHDLTADGCDGALLLFDRERERPLFTAGLQPPFDIGLIRAEDSRLHPPPLFVDRLISVDDADAIEWPHFARYHHLLIMPHGWFQQTRTRSRTRVVMPTSHVCRMPEPERYPLRVGEREVEVEVVHQRWWRNRGLMWRRSLGADHGMLFLYSGSRTRRFWMLNTLMDLSIAYISRRWQITDPIVGMLHPLLPGGEQIEPLSDGRVRVETLDGIRDQSAHHASGAPAQFVLEMRAGWFAENGIRPGATVTPGPAIRQFLTMAEE